MFEHESDHYVIHVDKFLSKEKYDICLTLKWKYHSNQNDQNKNSKVLKIKTKFDELKRKKNTSPTFLDNQLPLRLE